MAVDFSSAFSVGGAPSENVFDFALDGAGNTCVVGYFSGTLDFDPGPGVYELMGGGTFAAKYDPNGSLLWAQRVGASNSWFNFGPEIAAGADGSVYVVGTFENSRTFGATTLISAGDDDAYVVKLDVDGNFAWANRFGGAGADWGNDVAVDPAGNVYLMAETRTASSGNPDAFIAKLDSAGSVLWTRAIGASSTASVKGKPTINFARGFKLTVDSVGDIYATGRMSGTVDFDAGAGNTALAGSGFVFKLSTSGSLAWARTITGGTVEAHDIAVDASGNVYTTGTYLSTVDFDPGTAKSQKFNLSSTYFGAYISALDSDGNFRWARGTSSVDSMNYAWPEGLAVDGQGDVYLAGCFVGTVDFDPGAGTFSLASAGDLDAFVWKLNASGNFAWAGQMGGTTADRAHGIDVNASGNIFVAGYFAGTADFDPGGGTYELTSAGGADFFVVKLSQSLLMTALSTESAKTDPAATNAPASDDQTMAAESAVVDAAFADYDNKRDDLLLLLP
jgi:hypothetical protein